MKKKWLILCVAILALFACSLLVSAEEKCECTDPNRPKTFVTSMESTCCDTGYIYYECDVCGGYIEEEIPIDPTAHAYEPEHGNYVSQYATTKQNGIVTSPCIYCGGGDCSMTVPAIYKMKLSATKFIYDGKAKKPSVKVYNTAKKLIDSRYYKVTYSAGRKAVGTYKVVVTFAQPKDFDDYHDIMPYKPGIKLSATFTITPKKTKITKIVGDKKSFKVAWKKITSNVTGYGIRYSLKSDMTKSVKKAIPGKSVNSAAIKKLKSNKVYYVQVCTYKTVSGKKICSPWSATMKVKTK